MLYYGTQNYNKPEMLQLNQQMHKCICRMCNEDGQAGHEIQEIYVYCISHCALGKIATNTGLPVTLKKQVLYEILLFVDREHGHNSC